MGVRGPAPEPLGSADASQHGRGYAPLVGLNGNTMIVQLDTEVAARMRTALRDDVLAPLDVSVRLHEELRDYLGSAAAVA
jgi:hypothetical protein